MTPALAGALVLVEGESDRAALVELAGRRGSPGGARSGGDALGGAPYGGIASGGVALVVMSGYTNVARELRRAGPADRVAVLCDRGAEAFVARAVSRVGVEAGIFVCDEDLEDELIRALGTDAVLAIVDAEGERDSLRRLQNQPAHRHGDLRSQLRRFLGSKAGRKERYAPLLAAALPLDGVPGPLADALDHVGL
ncbi:ATP-dependent endonuclease [Pseudonocardia endophytica]|uniref:ATP-dependent endonuclease n=1 Tax=Pseudonocardia endophytica TaxID=401976 RepID=A0A4R1HNG4_PSEEN|nr:ATP-dependent endonuclease [Pseudonocardia endophytica]TCK22731.1 hypothetical protein EV378_6739 [Pseudonocardia endophytica]